jgi:hypothetical protein
LESKNLKNLIDFDEDLHSDKDHSKYPEGQQGSDKGKSVLDTIMDEFNVTSADSETPNQSQNELKLILLILKAKLIAKKIMIQNLTKENIDLFERIGTEREKHEVRIAYLEHLLWQNGISFDTLPSIDYTIGSSCIEKEKKGESAQNQQPVSNEISIKSKVDVSDEKSMKSILKTQKSEKLSINQPFSLSHLSKAGINAKVHFDSEARFKADNVGQSDSNLGQADDLKPLLYSPSKQEMTATQEVREDFHEINLPEDFFEEDNDIEVQSLPTQHHENFYSQEMQYQYEIPEENDVDYTLKAKSIDGTDINKNNISSSDIPRTSSRKEGDDISTPKKLRTYRKSDNFQFDHSSPPTTLKRKAPVLLEKSFKTAAGKYVQRKVYIPSGAPISNQSTSSSIHQSTHFEKSPDEIIPILPNPKPSLISQGGQGMMNNKNKQTFKYNEVVRDKQTRKLMHGQDCPCCRDYYLATADLKRPGQEKSQTPQAAQNASKHRVWNARPATPPG